MSFRVLPVIVALLLTAPALADSGGKPQAQTDAVITAVEAEIERSMAELKKNEDAPPYFIGVEVVETQQLTVGAKDGALQSIEPFRWRWAHVDLRIGDPDLDSSHPLRQGFAGGSGGRPMPISDDPKMIQHVLWQEIDQAYRAAKERWAQVLAEKQVLVKEEPAPDLAPTKPQQELLPRRELRVDEKAWKEAARQVSAVFAEKKGILYGSVQYTGNEDTYWFVSSEGARVRHHESRYRVDMSAGALAEDGQTITLHRAFDSHDPSGLPATDVLVREATALARELIELRDAEVEEPYTGPAILSDRAAGVFFHEILGHRLEGHRLKRVDSAQTFRNRVGEKILPSFINVYDDPTKETLAGTDLRGYYRYDNEGVPATRVALVENGILKRFLQSRAPFEKGQTSNGHGRRQAGHAVATRQGNLIVTANKSVSDEKLREELVRRAKAANKEYALYIDEIMGGFTFTDRYMPNAFKIDVAMARRVYVDGRPDELVRGLDLIGTPLEAFSKIVLAGQLDHVFNGQCGAESGWVPVSAAAPSLLISNVETQRTPKGQDTPPLLPPPAAKNSQDKDAPEEPADGEEAVQ